MSSVLIAPEGSQRLAVGVIGLGNSSQERPRAPFDAARQVRRGAAALRSARSARALVARERRHLGREDGAFAGAVGRLVFAPPRDRRSHGQPQ